MCYTFCGHEIWRRLACVLLLAGLWIQPAWGQMGSQGTLTVTVLDQSGAVVPDANLTLQDLATNYARTAVTPTAGTSTFVNLPLGNYKLTVSKSGFETQVYGSLTVQAARVTDIKITLKVGAVATQVEVSAQAVPIETSSNAISGTVDLNQLEQLPMTGRDVTQLAYQVAGYAGARGTGGTWNGLPLVATGSNIDGVQGNTNRMKFQGNAAPIVSARLEDMQEMTIQTDMLGLNSGFGSTTMQINFVTRRGSNAFHGRIFESLRNDNLNANSWVNNAVGIKRGEYKLNDFGGSVGGPIIKNKLFFFGSFAMAQRPGARPASNTVLTPNAQQGIFTYVDNNGATQTINVLTSIAGSAAGQAAGLPTTINPATLADFQLINGSLSSGAVSPSSTPNVNNINWLNSSPTKTYYPAFRIDYNATEKLRFYAAFNNTWTEEKYAAAPNFPGPSFANRVGDNKSNRYTASLGIDWTITPNVINQLRGGFLYNHYLRAYNTEPLWLTQDQISWPIGASSYGFFNNGTRTYYPLWNISDNVSWQKGSHTMNFGFSFYREQDHYWNPPVVRDMGLGVNCPNDPACTVFENALPNASSAWRDEAMALYSVLAGRIGYVAGSYPLDPASKTYRQELGTAFNLNELSKAWGLNFQDSWRIKPGLTLNYGLRWDFTGDQHDLTSAYHSANEVSILGPSGAGNLFKPGTLGGDANPVLQARSHAYNPWNVSPQPALGLAWNPNYTGGLKGKLFGGGSTVIRAGAALRRFTPPYQYFWNAASNMGYAFYQTYSLNDVAPGAPTPTGTFTTGSLHQGDPLAPFRFSPSAYQEAIPQSEETFFGYWGGVNGMLQDIKQPYVMSWNFGIQRELGSSNVLEVRYLGNRSVHQWVSQNLNEVNIFENGFLEEFKGAQANLAINLAQPTPVNSFANNGLPGQQALPIMTTAGVDPTNGTFINYLNNGRAGEFASTVAGDPSFLCNMVGSVNFSPCLDFTGGAPVAGAYPINFFQANPFNAGKAGELMSANGWGNYHALQVDWRQRNWHGLQLNVNYTWSHTLGVQPDDSWTGGFSMFSVRDLRLSYGPTIFDYRHMLHGNGTYDLPFGKGKRYLNQGGVADKILGGWTVGTILTYQSGRPMILYGGYNTYNGPTYQNISGRFGDSGVVLGGVTPGDLTSSVSVSGVPGQTFANFIGEQFLTSRTDGIPKAQFITPTTTAGVDGYHAWVYGPNRFFHDLSITKAIPITERWRLTFQSQFLNVWNHPVWGTPTTGDIQSTDFGHATVMENFDQALGARQIEFRVNLEF